MTEGTYVITVRGVAGHAVRAAFDDVAMNAVGDTTVLRRAGTDQAALHGILQRIRTSGSKFSTFTWNRRNRRGTRWPGSRNSDG